MHVFLRHWTRQARDLLLPLGLRSFPSERLPDVDLSQATDTACAPIPRLGADRPLLSCADSQIPGPVAYLRPTRSTYSPCLPTSGKAVPATPAWLHEIKYDAMATACACLPGTATTGA